MASMQVQATVQLSLSDKEKSVMGEAIKEAQDFVAKSKDAKSTQLATVAGAMMNYQGRPVLLQQSHDWSGHFTVDPPKTMGGNGNGLFVHTATCDPCNVVPSTKAAVIYGTYDKALPQLGYLLAWYKPENCTQHKVYVEAGDLSKLVKQGWDAIEKKLDASQCTSRFVDNETGATAVAEITNQDGKMAWVGACFNRLVSNGNPCKA